MQYRNNKNDTTCSTFDEANNGVLYYATYTGEDNEDDTKKNEFNGMLFGAYLSNYWWKEILSVYRLEESLVVPSFEKRIWSFNHSGVRPWSGQNFHKMN